MNTETYFGICHCENSSDVWISKKKLNLPTTNLKFVALALATECFYAKEDGKGLKEFESFRKELFLTEVPNYNLFSYGNSLYIEAQTPSGLAFSSTDLFGSISLFEEETESLFFLALTKNNILIDNW